MAREQRRLAAIVAADVAGYSRLVGADEEGTLAALRAHRAELIDPLIAEHGGRIANTAGDSVLMEFPSAVDAVRCAIAMQQGMAERNNNVADAEQIRFRIGVHIGDVVAQGDDLLGDGVNIAARLEALAEPGGIALSDDAQRQVRDRLDLTWQDGGEQQLKNIARQIQVWHWHSSGATPAGKPATPALPDKPSIAVLAFDNLSGDESQEYFSDGIAEDVITSLSKFRWLFVSARNSSFTYKGKAVNIQQVGRELSVRYVLEGSVRKAANRVRINAQLIEAETGNHIWAERYDRSLDDVFEVQDEINARIVSALDPAIRSFETQAALRKRPGSLEAWDHVLRGRWHINRFRKDSNLEGRREFEKAVELDGNYAQAIAWLAMTYVFEFMLNWTDRKDEALEAAYGAASKAQLLDDGDALCHVVVGAYCFWSGRLAQSRKAAERAIELNRNSFLAHLFLGGALNFTGECEASVQACRTALGLSPNDPLAWQCTGSLAHAHYNLGDYDQALTIAERAIVARHGYLFARIIKTAALGQLGRTAEAGQALAEIRRLGPDFSPALFDHYPFEIAAQREHLIDGLRKAGIA